jgi:hypothetical protein
MNDAKNGSYQVNKRFDNMQVAKFTNSIEGKSPYQDTQDTSFNRSIKQGGSAYCDTETKSNLYFHLHDISKQNFFKGRNQKTREQ